MSGGSFFTRVARYCDPSRCSQHWLRPRLHSIPRAEPLRLPPPARKPGTRRAPVRVVGPMSTEARMAAYRRQGGRDRLTVRQERQVWRMMRRGLRNEDVPF